MVIVDLTVNFVMCVPTVCVYSSSCDLLRFEVELGFGTGRGNISLDESSSLLMITVDDRQHQPWTLLNGYCLMISYLTVL